MLNYAKVVNDDECVSTLKSFAPHRWDFYFTFLRKSRKSWHRRIKRHKTLWFDGIMNRKPLWVDMRWSREMHEFGLRRATRFCREYRMIVVGMQFLSFMTDCKEQIYSAGFRLDNPVYFALFTWYFMRNSSRHTAHFSHRNARLV